MALPPDPAADFPDERTAIVTGGASRRGIGRATARRLAAEEWSIAIIDLSEESASATASEVAREYGVRAIGLGVDISDESRVGEAIARILDDMPQVVGLVNNAGVSSPVPFTEVTTEEWKRVIDVNLHGTFHVTRAIIPHMVENRLGRIVNVSSMSAETGGGVYGRAAYSASKAALLGLSRTLARELGPLGITANSVCPGSIDTDIMGGPLTDDRKAVLLTSLPVGRVGTVDDVAGVINFLLGPEGGYLTGVTYDVNGGSHIA